MNFNSLASISDLVQNSDAQEHGVTSSSLPSILPRASECYRREWHGGSAMGGESAMGDSTMGGSAPGGMPWERMAWGGSSMGGNAVGRYYGGNQWGAMPWWGSALGGCHGEQYHGGLGSSIFVRKAACSAFCYAPHLGKWDIGNQYHNKPCYWVPACVPCVHGGI